MGAVWSTLLGASTVDIYLGDMGDKRRNRYFPDGFQNSIISKHRYFFFLQYIAIGLAYKPYKFYQGDPE